MSESWNDLRKLRIDEDQARAAIYACERILHDSTPTDIVGAALLSLQRRTERRIFPRGDWSRSVAIEKARFRRTMVLPCAAVAMSAGVRGQAWYRLVRRLLMAMCRTQAKCMALLDAHQSNQPLGAADRRLIGWWLRLRSELGIPRNFSQFIGATKHLLATASGEAYSEKGPTDEDAISALSLVRRDTAASGESFLFSGGDASDLKLGPRQIRDALEKLGVLARSERGPSRRRRADLDVDDAQATESQDRSTAVDLVQATLRLRAVRKFLADRDTPTTNGAVRAAAWALLKAIETGREPNAAEAARAHDRPVREVRQAVRRLRAELQSLLR